MRKWLVVVTVGLCGCGATDIPAAASRTDANPTRDEQTDAVRRDLLPPAEIGVAPRERGAGR